MKNRLLPIFLASAMVAVGLAGCGEQRLNSLTITNKEALTAEWVVGQNDREVEITSDPVVPTSEWGKKLKLVSSDPTVIYTTGSMIMAQKEGSSKISVTYDGIEYDHVDITIKGSLPEPAHWSGKISDAIKDLTPNNVGAKLYDLTGYVVGWQSGKAGPGEYGNYYLADSIDETDMTKCAYVYGSNPGNVLPVWNGAKYPAMTTTKGFDTNELTKDTKLRTKISLTAVGEYYNGTTQEFLGKVTAVDHSQENPDVPEPAIENKTLAEVLADAASAGQKAFKTEFKVKEFATSSGDHADEPSEYGNMNVTDANGQNPVLVYGATATASALKWNKTDKYSFTNPKDFKTNEVTKTIAPGDTVEATVIRADYNGTKELCAIVTKVTKGEQKPCETITLNPTAMTLNINVTKDIKATVTPDGCTDQKVWSSSDETVATVSSSGVVKALKAGDAVITCTCGQKTATCNVTVTSTIEHGTTENDPLTTSEAIDKSLALGPNNVDTKDLTDYYVSGVISEITYKWDTKNMNLSFNMWIGGRFLNGYKATVAEGGVDGTTIAVGDTVLYKGKLENYKGKAEIQTGGIILSRTAGTLVATDNISVNPTTMSLDLTVEDKKSGTVAATVDAACTMPIKYEAGEAGKITVKDNGMSVSGAVVTAAEAGNDTVTAKCGEKTAVCNVTVEGKMPLGDSITFDFADAANKPAFGAKGGEVVSGEGKCQTINFKYYNIKVGSSATSFYNYCMISGQGCFFNTAAFEKKIVKITLTVPAGSAGAATYGLETSATPFTDAPDYSKVESKRTGAGDIVLEFDEADGITSFRVSQLTSGKNGQISKIVVDFAKAE